MGDTDPARAGQRQIKADRRMSHRLRLYFGSGRSNTAPELERLNGTVEDGDEIGYSGARATMFHTQTQNGGLSESPESGACSDASLKRSSSMFIPQLQGQTEPRTTKSTSVQISLQRSTAPQEDAMPFDPPPEYPQDPAPAYTEPGESWLLPPPPATTEKKPHPTKMWNLVLSLSSLRGKSFASGHVMDKMVMLVWVYPIIKGLPLEVYVFEEDLQMAQMSSSSGSCRTARVARMATIGLSSKAQIEVLEHKDFVFQLHQDQGRQPSPTPQADVSDLGITGTKGSRLVRYPRIRLERSTSQPLHPRGAPSRLGSMPNLHAPISEMETESEMVENGAQGCTFKIRKEPNSRQPNLRSISARGVTTTPSLHRILVLVRSRPAAIHR